MNCTELEKAKQGKTFFSIDKDERLDIIQDIIKECYKYSGNFHPDRTEFDYLVENIYQMTETNLKDVTPEEIRLVFMAGLSGEFERHCGKGKISLKLLRCFINRLFAFQYQCKEPDEPVTTFEYMKFVDKMMIEHMPDLVEYINESNKKCRSPYRIGKLVKQAIEKDE